MLSPEELAEKRTQLQEINNKIDEYKRMERKAVYWQRKLKTEAIPLRRILRAHQGR